jgi:hypothetical protein
MLLRCAVAFVKGFLWTGVTLGMLAVGAVIGSIATILLHHQ